MGAVGAAAAAVVGPSREAREQRGRGDWVVAVVAVLGTLALFFLTRRTEPPFSFGERLGYGILIGGLLGVGAGMWGTRARAAALWRSGVAAVGCGSLALFGAGLTLLIFRDYPQPALGGLAIGAVGTAVLFRLALPGSDEVDTWALSALALGAAVMLAAARYDTPEARIWWRAPLMVAAAAIAAQLASAATARESRRFALPALISSGVTLGLVAIFGWKVFPNWGFFWVAGLGVGTFALVAWLAAAAEGSAAAGAAQALAIAALAAVGFRLMAGFGIGIAMLAAWAVLLPALASARGTGAEPDERPTAARALVYAMFIGVGILLLRLFLEDYASELRGPDLRSHYTIVALAAGAILPFVLTSFFPTSVYGRVIWRAIAAGAVGVFAAAIPLVIVVIWGIKAALGFFIGTIAAELFILLIHSGAVSVKGRDYTGSALLVATAQVSAVQLSGLLVPLAASPRLTRVIMLGAAIAAGLVWAGITALAARRAAKEGQ